jgi:hypothetical protein
MPLDNVTLQGQPRISFDGQVVRPAWGSQIAAPAHCFILPRKHSASFLAAAASLLPQSHFSKQPTRHREHHNPSNILSQGGSVHLTGGCVSRECTEGPKQASVAKSLVSVVAVCAYFWDLLRQLSRYQIPHPGQRIFKKTIQG